MKNVAIILTLILSISFAFANGNENTIEYTKVDKNTTVMIESDADGNILEIGYFTNGKKDGLWTANNVDGTVNAEINYSNGSKNGVCKIYENQEVMAIMYYDNDEMLMAEDLQNPNSDLTISTEK